MSETVMATKENPVPVERAGLVSVCAWCAPDELRKLENATHGICAKCMQAALDEAFPEMNLGSEVAA